MTTEIRTYAGQRGTLAGDGFSGYLIGQPYSLRYERCANGTVAVYRDHLQCGEMLGPLVVSEAQFEKWWVG